MNRTRYASAFMVSLLISLLLLPQLKGAEVSLRESTKAADIKRLVRSMGIIKPALRFARSQLDSHISALQKTHPDIPDATYVKLKEELMSFIERQVWIPGGLVERLIPIYEKYLTHAEIRESVTFFESPLGKKWLSITLAMMRDSIGVGEKWEREIGPQARKRLYSRLREEGYALDE
jgi:hypothetical protein